MTSLSGHSRTTTPLNKTVLPDLKSQLDSRETTIGTWLTLPEPAVAEVLARSNFDWVTVDMEHSSITLAAAQNLVRVITLCGKPALVRVASNDPVMIKQAMDLGASGVIVPMVNSAEEARLAVSSAKYPPHGCRGVGLSRAQGYGFAFESYKDWNEKESVVIVQIEHIDGVNNLEDILRVDGVDALFIGPYDLSGSLGVPGQFDMPDVVDALARVRETAARMNVPLGLHVIQPAPEKLQEALDQGYNFIAYSLDTLFLGNAINTSLEGFR